MTMLIIIVALVEAAGCVYYLHMSIARKSGEVRKGIEALEEQVEKKRAAWEQIGLLLNGMIDLGTLRDKAEDYLAHQESLKAERGRITITQAELETVESRLRELEEIERELEASGLETKEELNILQKKKEDLASKKGGLEAELGTVSGEIEEVLETLQISAEANAQIDEMKAEVVRTQEKIDVLLDKIESGNEQYYVLKRRYDALDIEYAQLYEKFSASEIGVSGGDES